MWCRHVLAASLGFIAVTQCSILGSLLLMLSQLKPPFFFFLTFLSSVRLSFRKEVFFCFLGRGAANLNLHTRVSLLWIPNGIPLTYFKSNSSVTGPNLLTFCEQAGGARGGAERAERANAEQNDTEGRQLRIRRFISSRSSDEDTLSHWLPRDEPHLFWKAADRKEDGCVSKKKN